MKTADKLGQKLYLVERSGPGFTPEPAEPDLDLVAEGDAIKLADELAGLKKRQSHCSQPV